MNFISLECSTKNPSVSIFLNNKHTCIHQIIKSTSSDLPICVDQILKKNSIMINDINYIATTIGPGTFTGCRVGLSFSQGLAYSLDIPIVPINTIDVLNNQISTDIIYAVAMHSHKDFVIYKNINKEDESSIELAQIRKLKNQNVFGIGLENFSADFSYQPLKLTSLEVGEYAIENYERLVESHISTIKPIYLNEYRKIDSV